MLKKLFKIACNEQPSIGAYTPYSQEIVQVTEHKYLDVTLT